MVRRGAFDEEGNFSGWDSEPVSTFQYVNEEKAIKAMIMEKCYLTYPVSKKNMNLLEPLKKQGWFPNTPIEEIIRK